MASLDSVGAECVIAGSVLFGLELSRLVFLGFIVSVERVAVELEYDDGWSGATLRVCCPMGRFTARTSPA